MSNQSVVDYLATIFANYDVTTAELTTVIPMSASSVGPELVHHSSPGNQQPAEGQQTTAYSDETNRKDLPKTDHVINVTL